MRLPASMEVPASMRVPASIPAPPVPAVAGGPR